MIYIKNIRAFSDSRDTISLTWAYVDTIELLSDYTVQVIRAESEAGEFIAVSHKIAANTIESFEDSSVNLYSKHRDYHYRIRVEKTGTDKKQDFGSTDWRKVLKDDAFVGAVVLEAPPDLYAAEAIRRFDFALKEHSGRKVLVMTRRSTGSRCPSCWDNLKRRRTHSNCESCWGVGILGGYYQPKLAYCMKPPSIKRNAITPHFEMQPNDIVMWFSSRPRLKPKDLVIAGHRRYTVINNQPSEKGWSQTRQVLQLREITKDQIEFKIEITGWSDDNYSTLPKRNYLNATDIESYREYDRDKT